MAKEVRSAAITGARQDAARTLAKMKADKKPAEDPEGSPAEESPGELPEESPEESPAESPEDSPDESPEESGEESSDNSSEDCKEESSEDQKAEPAAAPRSNPAKPKKPKPRKPKPQEAKPERFPFNDISAETFRKLQYDVGNAQHWIQTTLDRAKRTGMRNNNGEELRGCGEPPDNMNRSFSITRPWGHSEVCI